ADFNGGESGDLLSLWCAVKRITLSEAIAEAREWLGITRQRPVREEKKTYKRPPKPRCVPPQAAVLDYLRHVREIPTEIIAKYKIGEDGNRIIFPFLLPDGTLALAKAREAKDGADPIPMNKDCEPVLFGWQAMPADAREVVLTEGEIDALSWAAYGYPAMSVPFGGGKGGKQQWIENEYDRLDRFEKIYISTDMDKPGDEAAEEIASRLGRHRCYRVKLKEKDANECLVAGIGKFAMSEAISNAESLDPEGLKRPQDYADKVINLFWPAPGERQGYSIPYGRLIEK